MEMKLELKMEIIMEVWAIINLVNIELKSQVSCRIFILTPYQAGAI